VIWDGHENINMTPRHRSVSGSFAWSDISREIVFATTRGGDPDVDHWRTYRLVVGSPAGKAIRQLAVLVQPHADASGLEPVFLTFTRPVRAKRAFFSFGSRLFATSLDGRRPLRRARWRLERGAQVAGAAVFLR
jgi:hypothetical protein